jgi:hypothetical protein
LGWEAKTETGGGASVAAAESCDRTNQAEERASAMGKDWSGSGGRCNGDGSKPLTCHTWVETYNLDLRG